MENTHIGETEKNELKQRALVYMPRNLGSVEAQRQILQMITEVMPPLKAYAAQADADIWPQVESQEKTMNSAIAQCAFQTDRIISTVFLESLETENLPNEKLMQGWIALDYYAYVLKEEYSANIRNLRDHITELLIYPRMRAAESGVANPVDAYGATEPAVPADDYGPTAPADEYGPTEPASPADDYGPTMPAASADEYGPTQPVVPAAGQDTVTVMEQKERKKVPLALKLIPVVAVLLAAALLISAVTSKPQKAKRMIHRIGTVTLDSAEKIERAEQFVEELTQKQKDKVSNLDTLTEARAEYDRLEVQRTIDQIGKVTMDSEKVISDAERMYDALPRNKRNEVTNYQVLTAARKELTRLQTAIKNASDAIDAIGEVTLDSGSKIQKARSNYDALIKDNLESYVADKLKILTAAEIRYDQCISEDYYSKAVALYDKGEYDQAIDTFNIIIKDYSKTTMLESAKTGVADCLIGKAQKAYEKNDQYNAEKIMKTVEKQYQSSDKYKKLMDKIDRAIESARPNTGSEIESKINWGRCYFSVSAGDQDACVKVVNAYDSSKYKLVYVRAGQSTKIYVEDGSYTVKWAYGDRWYKIKNMFGENTVYKSYNGTVDFSTRYSGGMVYYYYLNLDLKTANAKTITQNAY